jgi:hypothetical protein
MVHNDIPARVKKSKNSAIYFSNLNVQDMVILLFQNEG